MKKVEMVLLEILVSEKPEEDAVIALKERNGDRYFDMALGSYAAYALARLTQKKEGQAVFTHETMAELVSHFEGIIQESMIVGIDEYQTFIATVTTNRGMLQVRPSDAIYLALSFGAPIFATEELLQKVGETMPKEDPAVRVTPPSPPAPTLEKLNKDLQKAIQKEDYEKAAKIRDAILKLKK